MQRRDFLKTLALSAAAQPAKRPNILFVIADDWGFGHAGAYGAKWVNTPNFDRVAREGALFHNCFTSNPKCSPCRATILTGRNSWQLKEAINHMSIFPNDFAVYPDVLAKAGYFVGHTGKGWGPGDFQSTGFKHNPAGPAFMKHRNKPPANGIAAVDYASNFNYFLEQRPPNQPFCFWLGFQEPHRAYEDGSGIRAGKNPADVKVPAYFPDTAPVRSDMLDYALEVEWIDQHLGRVLKKLEETGDNLFRLAENASATSQYLKALFSLRALIRESQPTDVEVPVATSSVITEEQQKRNKLAAIMRANKN